MNDDVECEVVQRDDKDLRIGVTMVKLFPLSSFTAPHGSLAPVDPNNVELPSSTTTLQSA